MIETRRLKNALIFIQTTYIYASAQPEIFQGREGFMKLGHFDKISSNQNFKEKKLRRWKFWRFFILDALKTIFWMVNLT